jgi:hypothetical protein
MIATTSSVRALVDELQQRTGVRATGRHEVAAYEMPLTHRCGARHVDELLENFHASTELVPSPGSANRARLGLDGNVYQWLGPCAYPETNLIFVWEAAQDAAVAGVASPWDTGGLLTKGTIGRALSDADAMALLGTYSVELPAGRAYLGAVLECSFAEAGDYLEPRTAALVPRMCARRGAAGRVAPGAHVRGQAPRPGARARAPGRRGDRRGRLRRLPEAIATVAQGSR